MRIYKNENGTLVIDGQGATLIHEQSPVIISHISDILVTNLKLVTHGENIEMKVSEPIAKNN